MPPSHYVTKRSQRAPFVVTCACGFRTRLEPTERDAMTEYADHVSSAILARLTKENRP